MKITDIRYMACEINDESMKQFGDTLNDGFQLMQFDTSWNDRLIGIANPSYKVPSMIAIFIKVENEETKESDIPDYVKEHEVSNDKVEEDVFNTLLKRLQEKQETKCPNPRY